MPIIIPVPCSFHPGAVKDVQLQWSCGLGFVGMEVAFYSWDILGDCAFLFFQMETDFWGWRQKLLFLAIFNCFWWQLLTCLARLNQIWSKNASCNRAGVSNNSGFLTLLHRSSRWIPINLDGPTFTGSWCGHLKVDRSLLLYSTAVLRGAIAQVLVANTSKFWRSGTTWMAYIQWSIFKAFDVMPCHNFFKRMCEIGATHPPRELHKIARSYTTKNTGHSKGLWILNHITSPQFVTVTSMHKLNFDCAKLVWN